MRWLRYAFVAAAGRATSVADWTRALSDAVHRLTATGLDATWQVAQFDRELTRIREGVGGNETRLRHADVRALLRHRAGKTICPSDVARTLGGEHWRDLMPQIRDVAGEMAGVGEVTVTQKGETVDPCTARGPIRLAPGPDLAGMPADGE